MFKLWSNRKRLTNADAARETPLTLASLAAGARARVACLDCENAARCERLMAYGLVQGQTIQLIQKQPAFVVRVDETELALDEEIARCLRVQPL